jgi:hypothetical protein
MNIPSNKIVTGSYTSGKDFIYKISKNYYKGYFYKFNGSYYASRSYDENALEIVPAPKAQGAFSDPNSLAYSVLTGAQAGFQAGLSPSAAGTQGIPSKSRTAALQSIAEADKKGLIPQSAINLGDNSNSEAAAFEKSSNKIAQENTPTQRKRYFFRQINPLILGPDKKERIIIRECNEETYNKILSDPNYRKASLTETKFPNNPEPQFANQSEVEAAEVALPGLRKFLDIEFGF